MFDFKGNGWYWRAGFPNQPRYWYCHFSYFSLLSGKIDLRRKIRPSCQAGTKLFERISLSSLWFEMSLCLTHAIHSFSIYSIPRLKRVIPGSAVSFLPFRASQTVGSTNGMVWLGNIYPSQRSQSYDWKCCMYVRKSSVFLQKEESVNFSISASPTRNNGPPFRGLSSFSMLYTRTEQRKEKEPWLR